MTFIETAAAEGDEPNFVRAFSLHPEAYAAWRGLNGSVKDNMDPRRYELATVAAARRLRSSYCSLAHGTELAELMASDTVEALVAGDTTALDAPEKAIVELAEMVAGDAAAITEADVERARSAGLSDRDILDVVLAAAARCFFSKTLDALGVEPDASYGDVKPSSLRDALTVGRPIASS